MSFFRKIYQIRLTLRSPLSIGSGENGNTDKDVIVDGTGAPFIPATSLAGVLRHFVAAKRSPAVANAVFGYIPDSSEAMEKAGSNVPEFMERESGIRVYDGMPDRQNAGNWFISVRDMVALRDKVGIDGAKFDMEAVETGASFIAYIELLARTASCSIDGVKVEIDLSAETEAALSAMNAGVIRLGTKTSRGYGEVSLTVKTREFTDAADWLDFDMMDNGAWDGVPALPLSGGETRKLVLGLRLKGGISIREYTTEPGIDKTAMPDYKQLSLHTRSSDGTPVPVIPGTSWAGAIRSRFSEFARNEKFTESLFGFVRQNKDEGKAQKSNVIFSESRIDGGVWKTTTRNAIDRFTGGTKNGALYTEKTYYGGKTELAVSFAREPDREEKRLLCACFADLHNGFLSVGGLTSVGRGLFEIESVNGRPLSAEERKPEHIYEVLKKEVGVNE